MSAYNESHFIMIRWCFSLFFFLPSLGFAARGMVIALDVPLFSVPNLKAPVVQYVQKGDLLTLHPSHQQTSPARRPQDTKGFYLVLDRKGNNAYVPQKLVNLLIEGVKEVRQPRGQEEFDPTDHRRTEPLGQDIPLVTHEIPPR